MNQSVTFTCDSNNHEGNPAPDKFDFYFDNNNRVARTDDKSVWTTSFDDVSHSGEYSCDMRNDIGRSEKSSPIQLIIEGK